MGDDLKQAKSTDHHMTKILLLILVLLCLMTLTVPAQVPPPPLRNLQLEEGDLGQVPTGWFGNMPGYTARLLAEGAAAGKRSVEIEFKEPNPQSNFGLLRQSFDATPYRGKQVRFRAAVRIEAETPQDRAQLWFRVDRAGGLPGFFDNMDSRPIRSRDWQYFEITGDVAGDAQVLNIGMILSQKGRAWISDMTLVVIGDTPKPTIEPARPLTSRGLRNETAFARLFGYVRYFHPSDEAARADWEALAIRGARAVETAMDDTELAQALLAVFQPISPTLRIVGPGQQYIRPAGLNPPGANARVTYWKHHGVATGRQGPYRSDRVQETVAAATSVKISLPDAPFRGDLGDGLIAWLPSTLYVDGQGTLPHGRAAFETSAPQAPASADDRGTRLADVILAWNVFEHFYPYFDVVKTDWMAELSKALQRAAVDPNETAFTETLQRMVAALHDGHGAVNKAAAAIGILPLQWAWVENSLVITAVDPAAGLNVSVGDTVLTVNGQAARVALESREELISGATPQWIRYRGLQNLLTGPYAQTARLEVDSAKEPGKVTAVSARYGQPPRPLLDDKRPDKIAELEPGIFYLDIARASEADFNAALPQLEKARGIVFDFRGYPTGVGIALLTHLSDRPMTSAQWHIPDVTWPDRQGMTFVREGEWNLRPTGPLLAARKAFIVDGRAISYAESCLGIIENYKLGEIVGAPSAGTNGNVNPFTLPGGYTIAWTGMKVLKHDGSRHHGVGIQPTIPVSRTKAGIAAGRDEFLERAVAAVK